jgi:hypothetical protein
VLPAAAPLCLLLLQIVVDSVKAIDDVQARGNKFRTVGATQMNAESSRSHSIFTIVIETSEVSCGACSGCCCC